LDDATLTISSKNYSSWALRGWLMTKFSGLPFSELVISPDDPAMRAELLLLSSSFLVPCLSHNGLKVWDTLAIGEYLNEIRPAALLLPEDRAKRTRCRSISGEMHSGFAPMRSALPMNLKGDFPDFKVWARAQADIDRITGIWGGVPRSLRRAISVGRPLDGRRNVCSRGDAVSHISRQIGRYMRRLLQNDHGHARDDRVDWRS
jgi:glutathione S-transferase